MDHIIKIIVERLEQEAIEPVEISSCIETILNFISFYPDLNCEELNRRMQSIGRYNVKIDEHTFNLVKLISRQTKTEPVLR